MRFGSMAVLEVKAPKKAIHIVINNGVYNTVGNMPMVAGKLDQWSVNIIIVDNFEIDVYWRREVARLKTGDFTRRLRADSSSMVIPIFDVYTTLLKVAEDRGHPQLIDLKRLSRLKRVTN